jgi:uncharacterized protein (DUF58 family)
VPAERRGWLTLGRVMLETRFPVGLFRAWSYVRPQSRCLVYPKPEAGALPPPAPVRRPAARALHAHGSDDFSGLRAYQPSDSPRHVAWKSAARASNDMLTKQFAGEAATELWLDYAAMPPALALEARLSRLAGWVLAAERGGAHYGLRLPGPRSRPGAATATAAPASRRWRCSKRPALRARFRHEHDRDPAPELRPIGALDVAMLTAAWRSSSRRMRCARRRGSLCSPRR